MKAAIVRNYGGAERIEIDANAQRPIVKSGQVGIEVRAASLNRIDSAIRNGYMKDMLPLSFPLTMGGDFAGTVTEVGEGVTTLKVGDEVFGNAGHFKGGTGSLAEFTVANAVHVSLKPRSMDSIQAAALPLSGASALQAIKTELNVQAGQKILVQGGAGGIGSLAIQIAKLHGAYVATTVHSADVAFVKELGADEIIDYDTKDVTTILSGYDAVLDTAGGENLNKLFTILKPGGVLVTLAGQPDQELAKERGVKASSQMTEVSTQQLTELAQLVDNGKLKEQIEKTFPLDQSKEAFVYFENEHPNGKVVVEIK